MPSLVQKPPNYREYTSQLLPHGCPILEHLPESLVLLRLETASYINRSFLLTSMASLRASYRP